MAGLHVAVTLSLIGITTAFLEPASTSYQPLYSDPTTTPGYYIRRVTEHGLTGEITSPNYPSYYPNKAYTVYDIGRFNTPTRLIFTAFDLEYCPGCECDNVTIKPHNHNDQPLVFCGSTLPNGNGVLDFPGQVKLQFQSNFVYAYGGFKVRYEIGQQPTSKAALTTLPPTSMCPPVECVTCTPGYVYHYRYDFTCPYCECVRGTTQALPPTSMCPPVECVTCTPGYVYHYRYDFTCPYCECVRGTTQALPPTSMCPPVECPTCTPGYVYHYRYDFTCPYCECVRGTTQVSQPASKCPIVTCPTCAPGYIHHYRYDLTCPYCECVRGTTIQVPTSACPPATCPTCAWGYAPRMNYQFSCPECRCVYVGTSPYTWPPASTYPAYTTTVPVPASTYPPYRGILSELFRIHGELSDLQDKAKQIDNDVINIIQQIDGASMGQSRSQLLESISDGVKVPQDDDVYKYGDNDDHVPFQ